MIGLAIAPVAATYLRVKHEQGLSRTRGDAVQFGARPADYVTVSHQPRLWSRILPIGAGEKELFPGLVVIVLALGVLVPAMRRDGAAPGLVPAGVGVPLYAGIAVAAFVLSMGPEPVLADGLRFSTGPYDWLAAVVPGLDGLRAPARFAPSSTSRWRCSPPTVRSRLLDRVTAPAIRAAIVLVLGVAAMAEGYMGPLPLERFPSADMAGDRAAYEWLATQPPGPMIELPLGEPDPAVRYQFRTLIHGNRIVNGYSGYGSALQDFLRGPPSTESGGADQLAMFRALGLRYVVIHGQLYARRGHRAARDRGHAGPGRARRPHDDARAGHDRRAAIDRPGDAAATGRRRDPARRRSRCPHRTTPRRCLWPSTATTRRAG